MLWCIGHSKARGRRPMQNAPFTPILFAFFDFSLMSDLKGE